MGEVGEAGRVHARVSSQAGRSVAERVGHRGRVGSTHRKALLRGGSGEIGGMRACLGDRALSPRWPRSWSGEGRTKPSVGIRHGSGEVERLDEPGTEGQRGAMERPSGSSLRRPNRVPPCPGAGGGRARVPGQDAEPPCHGPRLRHLAVARATSRRGGVGAQGIRRAVSSAAFADEIAGASRSPGDRRDPARGRLRQPHEYRRSRRPRRGRSLLHCGTYVGHAGCRASLPIT